MPALDEGCLPWMEIPTLDRGYSSPGWGEGYLPRTFWTCYAVGGTPLSACCKRIFSLKQVVVRRIFKHDSC